MHHKSAVAKRGANDADSACIRQSRYAAGFARTRYGVYDPQTNIVGAAVQIGAAKTDFGMNNRFLFLSVDRDTKLISKR